MRRNKQSWPARPPLSMQNPRSECASPEDNFTSPAGGCQLVFQKVAAPSVGGPVLAVRAEGGEFPSIVGGAPLQASFPEVAGYTLYPGLSFYRHPEYDYGCADRQGSLDTSNTVCVFRGTPQELASACDADVQCQAFVAYPAGQANLGEGGSRRGGGLAQASAAVLQAGPESVPRLSA